MHCTPLWIRSIWRQYIQVHGVVLRVNLCFRSSPSSLRPSYMCMLGCRSSTAIYACMHDIPSIYICSYFPFKFVS